MNKGAVKGKSRGRKFGRGGGVPYAWGVSAGLVIGTAVGLATDSLSLSMWAGVGIGFVGAMILDIKKN